MAQIRIKSELGEMGLVADMLTQLLANRVDFILELTTENGEWYWIFKDLYHK